MADLLRCVDRWGREIRLTEEQWRGHIVVGHAALAGHATSVETALTDPDFVNFDASTRHREAFYRAGTLPHPLHRLYLKVVVWFDPAGGSGMVAGEVVTAYPTRRIPSGEVRKWP